MDIEEKAYSFKEVKEGIKFDNDIYGIGSYMAGKGIKDTFLSAPALVDYDETMIVTESVDGVLGGRVMLFPSRLKVNHEVIPVTSGSSLHVEEQFRHLALGVSLMMYPLTMGRPLLYAGLSVMAEPVYNKMGFAIFHMPRMWQIRKSDAVLKSFGLRGLLLAACKTCLNPLLAILPSFGKRSAKSLLRHFKIERLASVPQWAADMVLSDNHKYAELHDRKWMQWVLDHNFFGRKEDNQSFYGVFRDNEPVGFLLLAERNFPIPDKKIDKCVFGYVLDWDTIDSRIISEEQLKRIALGLFSKEVDIVQIDSMDNHVRRSFRKYGFIKHGYENMGFKDITERLDKDWDIADNWRLRASCSDRPFY